MSAAQTMPEQPVIRHDLYRVGHVDGVHCAGSVECDWRGETVEAWQRHREEMEGKTDG